MLLLRNCKKIELKALKKLKFLKYNTYDINNLIVSISVFLLLSIMRGWWHINQNVPINLLKIYFCLTSNLSKVVFKISKSLRHFQFS